MGSLEVAELAAEPMGELAVPASWVISGPEVAARAVERLAELIVPVAARAVQLLADLAVPTF